MSTDNCPAWEYGTCTCKVECPDDRTERTAAEERADRVTRLRRRAEYWEFKAALRDAADRIRERRPPAMTAYPMLNTERARIVNEAVVNALGMTANECQHPEDEYRWRRAMVRRYYPNRLHMERWP